MQHANKKNKQRDSIKGIAKQGEKKMTKVKQYLVAAILTAVFVAGTAFATAKDAHAPVADESSDNASISFTDGNVEYNGKTGWQMIGDLAGNIR
jgi:hypothetical protein